MTRKRQALALIMGFVLLCASSSVAATHPRATQECKAADFSGRYSYSGLGYDVRSQPPSPMALSGTLEADGQGGFLYWDNTVAFLPPQNPNKTVIHSDLLDDAEAAGSELRYELTPNCRLRIFGTVQTPLGPAPLELVGGLADGGRRALLQLGSPFAIGIWTAEASDSFPRGKQ